MPTKLEHALALAAKGFRVFPLAENSKTPLFKGWPEAATVDLDAVQAWWAPDPHTGWASERNIGIATGHHLAVLDVDNKGDISGDSALALLEAVHGDLPYTWIVRTPSGGYHYYFWVANDVRNSAAAIAPGLDVRGARGYVVAPGSTIGDDGYRVYGGTEPAAAPDWLVDLFAVAKPYTPKTNIAPLIELDKPANVARAVEIAKTLEPSVPGGSDPHTFNIACKIKDLGVSEPMCLDIMLEHWNERCSPAWMPEDLKHKVENAYAHGHEPIGSASPDMDFEYSAQAAAPSGPPPSAPNALPLVFARDAQADSDLDFIVDDFLVAKSFSMMYGKSGAGKSFVALDLAAHVALGKPWLGHETTLGAVLYVAAEGAAGIQKRLVALQKHFGVNDFPLAVVAAQVTVTRKDDRRAILAAVESTASALGLPVSLIILDTLNAVMEGDENSSVDMRSLNAAVKAIIGATGAHVMVIHHSGKDAAKGARGHSSLRAAVDTELEIADNCLRASKQRDAESADVRRFERRTIELGVSRRGKTISSCVIVWGESADDFVDVALTPEEQDCREVIESVLDATGRTWVTYTEIAAAYATEGDEQAERTLRRRIGTLVDKGNLRKLSRGTWGL